MCKYYGLLLLQHVHAEGQGKENWWHALEQNRRDNDFVVLQLGWVKGDIHHREAKSNPGECLISFSWIKSPCLKSYCKFMEAYSKVQIQFSATWKLINKKWLNSRSTAASSQKAPSRNLLLSSHPLKQQQAQINYLLLVKPISKLLPGWSKEGAMEEGRFLPASLLPSGLRVPQRIIVSCPDFLGRLQMKPMHLHGGNICKKSTERAA